MDSRLITVALAVCILAHFGSRAADNYIPLNVQVELKGERNLQAADIKFAVFPGGKRCAFLYTGPQNPTTISALSKLGFRTTIYLGPDASPESIKAYEDAG